MGKTLVVLRWARLLMTAPVALLISQACVAGPPPDEPVIRINAALLRSPDASPAMPVALPDSWNSKQRSGTWEYTAEFGVDRLGGDSWGLYVPRAGNRFAVYFNDKPVGQLGGFDGDLSDHAQRPHFFFLPVDAVRLGRNQLRFVVQGEKARYAGLSNLVVGPAAAVRPLFIWREVGQVWGSFAIIFVSVVFGLIAGALAFSVKERSFTLFALACLLCAVRTTYAVVTDPPMDYRLWTALLDSCYAGYLTCLCLFSVEVLALQQRWIGWVTAGLLLATAILIPPYVWLRLAQARQVLLMLMVIYAATLCVTVIHNWYRTRTPASRVLAMAGAICVTMALHDHIMVFYTADGYASFALARYSLITFVVAMGWLLVDRYARNAREETALRRQLAAELRDKKLELEAQFDRQQQLVSDNIQQKERQRILQDLHDGMGLQLNGLLGMLQRGPLKRDELSREVRTTIEQMRMLMDSTEAFDGDVSILLGHIRYRIEQRLNRQSIQLNWDVQLDQPQRVLAPQRAIALQRLVFELSTNALKHSGATRVSFTARDGPQAAAPLRLGFADNGRGYVQGEVKPGVGTRTIERRVSDLGATLKVESTRSAGVRFDLAIPASSFNPVEGAIPAPQGGWVATGVLPSSG